MPVVPSGFGRSDAVIAAELSRLATEQLVRLARTTGRSPLVLAVNRDTEGFWLTRSWRQRRQLILNELSKRRA